MGNGVHCPLSVDWLGGQDSNLDNQIQSLMSYRLNDLPAERGKEKRTAFGPGAP